jgi:hypothetical protein
LFSLLGILFAILGMDIVQNYKSIVRYLLIYLGFANAFDSVPKPRQCVLVEGVSSYLDVTSGEQQGVS